MVSTRTKRVILEMYDEMRRSIEMGEMYKDEVGAGAGG
jgi:hypothetical protein